jgi:hemerythrin-like domain-containing protein
MRPRCIQVIQEEHQALSAMLRSLGLLLQQARRDQRTPDFGLIRCMLFYLDEFAEKLHHRKESELLFPRLRRLSPEASGVLDGLEREHIEGERAIRDLEHALIAFEVMGDSRRLGFEQQFERYSRAYMMHMGTEEQHVLPAALHLFSQSDWAALDEAFDANRDPLTGHLASEEYRPLFRTILATLPAPLGLG